jgi:DNA-binding winged helix-turn-helix (wHTH) protein/Tol biopolymer transport system component
MLKNGASSVRFGLFEADLQSGELSRQGTKVRLQEQPFQILTLLLEKPGEIVTREELRARLWPADTFVDFDHGLNAGIKRLRDALGDSAENPRFIETLARRGYRFIAPVHRALPESPKGESEPTEKAKNPTISRVHTRRWLVLSAVVVVVAVGVAAGWHAGRRSAAAALPAERRLTSSPENDPIWSAALSPDGKYLAFTDKSGAYLELLSSGEIHAVSVADDLRTASVSWFPDGGHLLATRRRWPEGKPGLWSLPALGGSSRALIEDGSQGVVSLDGSQIAFVRGDYLQQEIWVSQADGGHPRKIAGGTVGAFGSLAWSPNGERIAFLRYAFHTAHEQAEVSVGICDPATGTTDLILSNPNLWEGLAWSRDGRLIFSLGEPPPNRSDSNLWVQKIDGRTYKPVGPAVRLTRDPDGKTGINLSADGSRLTYLRVQESPEIYISEVEDHGKRLGPSRRLGLGEGKPYTWTPDNHSVIFISDRDGVSRLYKQGIEQGAPELLVGGDTTVAMARLDAEGTGILYLLNPKNSLQPSQIMRIPVSGGPPQQVLAETGIYNLQCARAPSNVCVFSRIADNRLMFYTFDPTTGKEAQFRMIAHPDWILQNWSLSPDGSTLALSGAKQHRVATKATIRLWSLAGSGERILALDGWFAVACLDWAADGKSIWVNAANAAGKQNLLNVDLRGGLKSVLEETTMELGWAIPSSDGKHVALLKQESSSNTWQLENF